MAQQHATNTEPHQHAPVLATKEARQGATPGHMRYVLAFGLALALSAGVVIWLWSFA